MTRRPYLKITTHKIIKSNHIGQRVMLCTMHITTIKYCIIIYFTKEINYYVKIVLCDKRKRGPRGSAPSGVRGQRPWLGQGVAPLAGS